MKDFLNHSAPMKSSVQPFGDIATLKSIQSVSSENHKLKTKLYTISGSLSNHSGENDEPENTKPGLRSVSSAQMASMMVMSSRLPL